MAELTQADKDVADALGLSYEQVRAQKTKDEHEAADAKRMQDTLLHGGPQADEARMAQMFGCKSIAEYREKYPQEVDPSIFEDDKKFQAHLAMMELQASAERRATEAEIRRRGREDFYAKHGLT
jgi:hypothetical protein